jgi:hypothetical protein
MTKLQRLFQTLIILGLLLLSGASSSDSAVPPTPNAPINQLPNYPITQLPNYQSTTTPRAQDIPDAYDLVGENGDFQLYANRETLAFKVVDKRSEYIWHSNLDEVGEDDNLNRTWTAFAQSGISIDYLDSRANDERLSITNSENSIEFAAVDQGFEATVTFEEASITLAVVVQLEESGVRVEIPFDSIREEDPDASLGLVYVYPFLGATWEDSVPGYMFMPDGSGTLIHFAAETKARNMFYGRYYGDDFGMIRGLPFDPDINRPYKISLPVLGMVHQEKQNAFIAIIEKGASYGEIHAHPAGVTTQFNFLYNAFVYNESYFQATNRSGAGVTTLQPETNAFDVAIHYRFLTGEASDYVGMAKSYQQYLVDKGALPTVSDPESDIGIRLEFLGGEKEKVLFWNRLIPMTTIEQMGEILSDLAVQNPEVVYYGWQPLGASSMPPRSLRLDGRLGSMGALDELAGEITAEGGNLYLYLDPQAALLDESGYSTRYDLAMSITNLNLFGYNRNKVNYYLNLDAVSERYTALSDDLASDLQAGWALDGIGSSLYSDFKDNNFLNRELTMQQYQALMAEDNVSTAYYLPNDYLFGTMQAYYDIPLGDSGYIYTTDTVPFLQIVLAGYVPYYGKALNFSSNLQADLLRHVDFGVYPSYFLSEAVTAEILNTSLNWVYTSSYDQWGEEIEETYQWLNNLLGPVKGEQIVARHSLAPGVVATTYSNGYQVIVNYNNRPFEAEGLMVEGQDAVVTEVRP